jgi:hypothetical protein
MTLKYADDKSFGEHTSKLFEGIDESELSEKMQESVSKIFDMLDKNEDGKSESGEGQEEGHEEEQEESQGQDEGSTPNAFAEKYMEHLKKIMNGKIGALASELVEEMKEDFKTEFGDIKDESDAKGIFKKLMKNPQKLMKLMKSVTDKLKSKMSSGEISKEELVKEATDMFKDMGGKDMGDFGSMFKDMAKSMGMGGAKMNMNALNSIIKKNEQKDRMRANLQKKKEATSVPKASTEEHKPVSNEDLDKLLKELDFGEGDIASSSNGKRANKKKKKC